MIIFVNYLTIDLASYLDKITVNQIRGGLSDTNYLNKLKSAKNIKNILKAYGINHLFIFLKFSLE